MMTLAELLKILRRTPSCSFVRTAIRQCEEGTVPSVELLRRCGVRVAGEVVL